MNEDQYKSPSGVAFDQEWRSKTIAALEKHLGHGIDLIDDMAAAVAMALGHPPFPELSSEPAEEVLRRFKLLYLRRTGLASTLVLSLAASGRGMTPADRRGWLLEHCSTIAPDTDMRLAAGRCLRRTISEICPLDESWIRSATDSATRDAIVAVSSVGFGVGPETVDALAEHLEQRNAAEFGGGLAETAWSRRGRAALSLARLGWLEENGDYVDGDAIRNAEDALETLVRDDDTARSLRVILQDSLLRANPLISEILGDDQTPAGPEILGLAARIADADVEPPRVAWDTETTDTTAESRAARINQRMDQAEIQARQAAQSGPPMAP